MQADAIIPTCTGLSKRISAGSEDTGSERNSMSVRQQHPMATVSFSGERYSKISLGKHDLG